MIIKFAENQFFKAGDHTTLKEVLHPVNRNLDLPFSMAFAFLEPGESSLLHFLTNTEIYFITSGSVEHLIAPDRFIQITIQPNQTATWIMERIKSSHWDGFHIYDQSLVHQIQELKQVPSPAEIVFPKIKGWPWA